MGTLSDLRELSARLVYGIREMAAEKITEWGKELNEELRPPYTVSKGDAALLDRVLEAGARTGVFTVDERERVELFRAWLQKRESRS